MSKSPSLGDLPNLGAVIVDELKEAGITTPEELAKTGSVRALLMIRGASGRGCYNMLYALEGAIQKTRWHNLPKEERSILRKELEHLIDTETF